MELFRTLLGVLLIQRGLACYTALLQGSVCCKEIGTAVCFQRSAFYKAVPQCPSSYSVDFTLYTRANQQQGFTIDPINVIPSTFSNRRQTVFIVHDWIDSVSTTRYKELRDVLLSKADLNVITVNWQEGASSLTYVPAAANAQSLGAYVGALSNNLRTKRQRGDSPYYWCIGHGLGAHACGFSVRTASPFFDRITGLDPTGLLFPASAGLTKSSASRVDVVHTDAFIGSLVPRGHVDFYPNGGKSQPGCLLALVQGRAADPESLTDDQKIQMLQKALTERENILDCSHQRAFHYFLNSVQVQLATRPKKNALTPGNSPALVL